MRDWIVVVLLIVAVPAFLAPTTGCQSLLDALFPPTDNGDPNNPGQVGDGNDATDGDIDGDGTDGDTTDLVIVKTDIAVRHDAGLRVGDDLIAFGTGALDGVSYIIPSEAPTAGTPVPGGTYRATGFAVGGRTIFLVDGNFHVSIYDVDAGGTPPMIAEETIRLVNIPVGANDIGHIQADGDYCVVRCDAGTVTDGKIIKVIDVSGATPTVIALNNPPDVSSGFNVQQVAVDAATLRVVAAAGSPAALYVYDLTTPAADPVEIALPNGIGDVQMQISGDYLIALDDQGYPQAFLANLATPTVVALTDANGIADADIGADVFAFFADLDAADSVGGWHRTAAGEVPGPGFTKAALDQYIDGSTTNNGQVGFAGSLCVTPDGKYIFLADTYLQYSTGGAAFVVPKDPENLDPWACPASDIYCSVNTVGFKTSATATSGTDQTVGYIRLAE